MRTDLRPALTALALLSVLAGCNTNRAELYPDIAVFRGTTVADIRGIDIPDGAGAMGCEPICGGRLTGKGFKFSRLHVTEPNQETSPLAGAMIDILNDMWYRDLASNVMNLLFDIGEVDFALGTVELEAGPGWFRRTAAAVAAIPDPKLDEVPGEDIEAFCLLEGSDGQKMTSDFRATLDSACAFVIDAVGTSPDGEGTFLSFHTGPTDDPVICAPEQGLTPGLTNNTIPMSIFRVRGRFNEDCSRIVDGYLEGCIALEHASRICMCLDGDYDCAPRPEPEGDSYCALQCGGGGRFLNFGGLVQDVAKIPPTCTVLGLEGIRIAGEFEAELLPEGKFDPERSPNCQLP